MRKTILAATLLIAFTGAAFAQQATLTRQDAIASALKNNASYQATAEDSRSAYYQYRSSWGDFLPTADLSYSYSDTAGSTSNTYSAEMGINLFRGFRSYQSMRTAQLSYKIASESEKEARLSLIRDVALAYQGALRAGYLLESGRTLFESADLLLKEAELKLNIGALSRIDLYQAEADREKAHTNMLDAEVTYIDAIQEIARLTGIQLADDIRIEDNNRSYDVLSTDEYIATALQYNITLTKAQFTEQSAMHTYKSSWGAFLPVVNASLFTRWNKNEQGDYNSHGVGLTATWNLFSGFSDANALLADSRALNSSRLTRVDQTNTVVYNIRTAVRKLEANRKKLDSSQLYVRSAEESYSATQEMFRIGRATLKETIDARATLEDAQASLADARYNIVQSYEDLNFLTGGAYGEYK